MRDFRLFASEKRVSAAWTRCVWICLTLWSVSRGENRVPRRSVLPGDGGHRTPTTCPALPSHCRAQVPWACSSTQPDCFKNKQVCQSPVQSSAYNAVNLTANIFYFNNHLNDCQEALNLTWFTRLNDYVGFLLKVTHNCPARGHFNHEILQQKLIIDRHKLMLNGRNKNDPLLFYYDCQGLSIASTYHIGLYGLRNNSKSSCFHQELIGVTSLVTDCDTYPKSDIKLTKNIIWSSYIKIISSDGNSAIQVHFTPAPPSFGFDRYTVLLWSGREETMLIQNEPGNASDLNFSCTDYKAVVFKHVCSGRYFIEIRAHGGKNCSCVGRCDDCILRPNNFVVLGSTYQCPSMVLVETQSLKVPTPYVTVTSRVAPLPVLETTESTIYAEKTSVIIIGSIVFAAVVIGAVVMYVTLSRNCQGVNGPLKRKQSVLLIYAKDNAYHFYAVHCLALYLQQRCYCEVKLDQWFQDEISNISALDWLLRQIRSVENVIVVNSEAGWRQYEGSSRNVAFHKIRRDVPLEDFFLFAIEELHGGKRPRVFKVAFPYTNPSYFIDGGVHAGRTYVLTRQIEDLVIDIHQLSKRNVNDKKLALDIRCEEGQLLEAAIKQASEFFLSNPDWFARFYYQREERNESLPRHDHPSPVYDSGIGPSIEQTSITSDVLKVLLASERLGINCYYPPSSLDDDSNSMTLSYMEKTFKSMNYEYENAIS